MATCVSEKESIDTAPLSCYRQDLRQIWSDGGREEVGVLPSHEKSLEKALDRESCKRLSNVQMPLLRKSGYYIRPRTHPKEHLKSHTCYEFLSCVTSIKLIIRVQTASRSAMN